MAEARGQIEVFKGKDDLWYFRLIADNGEVLASSEGHVNRIDVLAVINRYFTKGWTVRGGVDNSNGD